MKTIVTITGIRPDFIRMSEIFKKLDRNFNHILVHTGQHFNSLLSDVFFEQLNIRSPNFNLGIGGKNKEHFHQSAELSVKIIELLRNNNIKPDLIIFLGDSNSVSVAVQLKKEGYRIAHIEAGMRSYDKRMLEEINRIVCDHCSDYLFVYHENYRTKLLKENIPNESIFIVGNTIVEVVKKFIPKTSKLNDRILLDIHRPENFKYETRLRNILSYAQSMSEKYNLPVYMLDFHRTTSSINTFNIDMQLFYNIKLIPLLAFREYIDMVYHSKFIISDSGTAQEEPALLNTPVLVPRDYTERPESVENNCSLMININNNLHLAIESSEYWIDNIFKNKHDATWLGDGNTSEIIVSKIQELLC